MNKKLTQEIVSHIYSELAVLESDFIDSKTFKSIKSNEFLLDKSIILEVDGKDTKAPIWGIELKIDNSYLKVLLSDISADNDVHEYVCLVNLVGAPSYGLYGNYSHNNEKVNNDFLISVSEDGSYWIPCSTYLQATFLAGIEQAKETGFTWYKCKDISKQYEMLLSFIKHNQDFFEDFNEGQED